MTTATATIFGPHNSVGIVLSILQDISNIISTNKIFQVDILIP